jgi:hypothetical protein
MVSLSVKADFADVERSLSVLREDIKRQVLASSINKTIDLGRTAMVRQITSEFNLTAAYVRQRLRVRRALNRGQLAIEGALIGGKDDGRRSANIIVFLEKSVTLAEGKRRAKAGTQNQLFVKIKRAGGKKAVKGAFGQGAFIGNKGRTVFERMPGTKMASRRGNTKHSEQIKPVQVIDVAQMFNTRRINAAVVQMVKSKFPGIAAREIRFYTERFNRGAK